MVKQPRPLGAGEIEALLALDVPARLATLDEHGFPHVTPLWFIWADGAFCVDVEDPERADGERPNRQVRAIGDADVVPDRDADWTNRITRKYVRGPAAAATAAARAADDRVVICLRPTRLVAVASA
jgi:hypothetical protein